MSKQQEALRLALEALEEINKLSIGENAICLPAEIDTAMDAIREALAEQPAQQQEPVAWMFQHEETGRTMCVDAQQVEWGFEKGNPRLKKIAPLYTSPPASKPWVGLTDEEIREVGHLNVEGKRMLPYSFARAIEAKLREKNAAPCKPLTNAQIGAVAADIWGSILIAPQSYQAFARAIEAAIKENT